MRAVLLFDLETTGLDPQTCRVIEAAGALWSVPHRTLIGAFSFIVKADENPAERFNRIPPAVLRDHGIAPTEAEKRISAWFGKADAIVAHNAPFDASFLPTPIRDMRPWIDTKADVEWPHGKIGCGLRDLAADHGVGIVRAHRAASDVDILVRLFERVAELGHDVEAMLLRAMRPKATFAVADTRFDEARNELAKQNGFRWEKPHWIRRMAIEDAASLPFAVRQLDGSTSS